MLKKPVLPVLFELHYVPHQSIRCIFNQPTEKDQSRVSSQDSSFQINANQPPHGMVPVTVLLSQAFATNAMVPATIAHENMCNNCDHPLHKNVDMTKIKKAKTFFKRKLITTITIV